eukprot:3905790-Pyramimonas_sp.AAC.1
MCIRDSFSSSSLSGPHLSSYCPPPSSRWAGAHHTHGRHADPVRGERVVGAADRWSPGATPSSAVLS